jgi:hypothetical protein
MIISGWVQPVAEKGPFDPGPSFLRKQAFQDLLDSSFGRSDEESQFFRIRLGIAFL